MRVLAASRGDAASYYRITSPFSILRYRGLDVEMRAPTIDDAGKFDVLWLQMHATPVVEIVAREFKARGGKLVYDVDDWLFELPPSWPSYDHFYARGYGEVTDLLLFHERLIQLADVVTTTTPYLAGKLRERFDVRVEVLPNCIMAGDWDILPEKHHDREGPVLGWMGTGNHWDDWMEIVDSVAAALDDVDGHLALIGAPEMMACFPAELKARTLWQPLVPMARFQQVRELMKGADVGLAWATDRLEISRCRSPLKALQWGAAGKPIVASATVYGEFSHAYGVTLHDFLRHDLEAALVGAYQRDTALRAQADAWQREVFAQHSYEVNAGMWERVLRGIAQ